MLNAFVEGIRSIMIAMIKLPEFKNTFFNGDLDRGFSVIHYNLNDELVCSEDLKKSTSSPSLT
ncbi:MAG: sucrose phosphorylase [Psychromonas sp.]|jgi:sucrose phosphorylase